MNIKGKTILITGGAGNIGSALTQSLCSDKNNLVIVVDNLVTGNKNKLVKNCDNLIFINANVNVFEEISTIMLCYRPEYAFHYAALVGVERTLKNPIRVLDDIKGINNILTLCKNTGVKKIFYSSSSEVYGEPIEFPQNENTTPLNSKLTYAVVKNIGESYLRAFHQEYNLDYTIFRFFNTYGINQSEDFVVPRFIHKALKNEAISIYGDGSQSRTFCYINDNVEATLKVFDSNEFNNQVINIGSNEEITILELAKKIISLTKSKSKIVFFPKLKEGDMTRRLPDIKIMSKLLNKKLITIDEGILKLIKYYNENSYPDKY